MNNGRFEQVASPTEVYERPATPFVFNFLDAVNTFRGRIEGPHMRIGNLLLPTGLG